MAVLASVTCRRRDNARELIRVPQRPYHAATADLGVLVHVAANGREVPTRPGRGADLVDPSENTWTKSIYDANQGIGSTPDEREKVARVLGFRTLFASVNADGIWEILRDVPIVYAGRWAGRSFGHWVVMVGISGTTLAINNPAAGMETVDYNYFVGQVLEQTAERPLIFP